jgi:hypothetical protein
VSFLRLRHQVRYLLLQFLPKWRCIGHSNHQLFALGHFFLRGFAVSNTRGELLHFQFAGFVFLLHYFQVFKKT